MHFLAIEISRHTSCIVDIPNAIDVMRFRRLDITASRCCGRAVDDFLGSCLQAVEGCGSGDGDIDPRSGE